MGLNQSTGLHGGVSGLSGTGGLSEGSGLSATEPAAGGPSGDALLLESGDYLLLESGDFLLLE